MKTCIRCNQEKNEIEFFKNHGKCKLCYNAHRKERAALRRAKREEKPNPEWIVCSQCNIEKPKEAFPQKRKQCRSCIAQKAREYTEKNKDKLLEYQRERHRSPEIKAKHAETMRKYFEKKREKAAEQEAKLHELQEQLRQLQKPSLIDKIKGLFKSC
jgi:hypothetical protein